MKYSPPAFVAVVAPEHARLAPLMPPPMKASAALERWQRSICSAVFDALSKYAVPPSASCSDSPLLVLPAQRPASPEMYESPTVTTHGVPTPGPSA